jgi:ZIP family zinc transporter
MSGIKIARLTEEIKERRLNDMAKVAIEMVKKPGASVNEIVDLLVRNAAAAAGLPAAAVAGAVVLAIGIGIQNLPEGLAVSISSRREGRSRYKSFWYGQLSGVVEPAAGVLGAAFVLVVQPVLPYALSFAAGAMIFVVVEEVIPESQQGGNTDLATMGTMIGFAIMMVLDVALG